MNAAEHKAEAERLLTGDQLDIAAAQAHATLATIPDPAPVDPPADPLWDAPLYKAAALLERVAVGDEGPAREHTIARLVLAAVGSDVNADRAADIAVHALHAARDGGNPALVKAVEAAIATLGISTDAD